MAHAYSKLYGLPTIGLRFFTVYGPWGRPDMSPFLFIDAILHDRPIKVFNNGDMWRDFTYIDDIVEGIVRITSVIPQGNKDWDETNPDPATSSAPYRIYNIGNSQPTRLMDYIHCIENSIGHEAQKTSSPCSRGCLSDIRRLVSPCRSHRLPSVDTTTIRYRQNCCMVQGIL